MSDHQEWLPMETAPKDGTVIHLQVRALSDEDYGVWGFWHHSETAQKKGWWIRTPDGDTLWLNSFFEDPTGWTDLSDWGVTEPISGPDTIVHRDSPAGVWWKPVRPLDQT